MVVVVRLEVRNETESNWQAFAAGGADLGITFMGGVSAKSIFAIAAGANSVVVAVVVSVSLGFLVSSARSQMVDYIKDARIASRSSVA